MNDRIHACLDGELSRDRLTAEEFAQLETLETTLAAVTLHLEQADCPNLTRRVMDRLPAAAWQRPGLWQRMREWMWAPRSFQITLRPAYALAGAAMIALVAPNVDRALDGPAAPVAEAPAEHSPVYVQFRVSAPGAADVQLAGTFTAWQPEYQLHETAPGVWSVMVPLEPGVHDYAFLVDGEEWVADPNAPQIEDSFGGTNSRIALAPMPST